MADEERERQDQLEPGVGAESGSNRSSEDYVRAPGQHKTRPEQAAHVGSLTTRTPAGTNQGIANRSIAEEDARQESVVERRPDAQAGLNSLRKPA